MTIEKVWRDLKFCAKWFNRALHDLEKAMDERPSNGLMEVTERMGEGELRAVLKKLDIRISGFILSRQEICRLIERGG